MDGILLIDKSSGPTSFDIVRTVRKRAGTRRVGHAGTLDPLASGLLAVCLGQGTKLVPYLMDGDKRYTVTVALGQETDTLDSEGEVVREAPVPIFDRADIRRAAASFVGMIPQVPPAYSAIKRDGEALYKKARRGEAVAIEPRTVRIDAIDVIAISRERISLDVTCGKGTYIRSLARDIAVSLGTVGHVTALRRTASSGFAVGDAHPDAVLDTPDWEVASHLVSMADALPTMPRCVLSEAEVRAVGFGQSLPSETASFSLADDGDDHVALVDGAGCLVAISRRSENGVLKIVRGFPR